MLVAEAARRLGVGRARIYQLLEAGALDSVGTQPLRITLDSLEQRLHLAPTAGAPLASLGAWAVLALASGDAAFLRHVAGLLSDPDRSRARARLQRQRLVELSPRLRGRAVERRFVVQAQFLVDLLADPRVVLGGTSAARVFGWPLTDGTWPGEAYVPESHLVALVETYGLERDERSSDLVLRSVQEPWPFPPQARVVPAAVAALDLVEARDAGLVELGTGCLDELTRDVVADWLQRPPRRRPVRPVIPTGPLLHSRGRKQLADDLVWDDRADHDATQLVGLLFVAATPLRRTDVAGTLKISQGRLARACAVLQADPPRGLRLQEAGDTVGLVSGPECADTIERHLGQPAPEALSQAALDTLAIIAYEQPVTRADIRGIRSVDSDAVVETLRARGLVAEDPRFGGRGRPGFLITTPAFLQYLGLSSLSSLPPRDRGP
jgi:segregation and condensation protein B